LPKGKGVSTYQQRSVSDWLIFLSIYAILIGGIGWASFEVYGSKMGVWVTASAAIAGLVMLDFFRKEVPGETFMKIVMSVFLALNAGYLAHNGLRSMGVEAFNNAQVRKYEAAMAAAARARTKTTARQIGLDAKGETVLAQYFSNDQTTLAAVFAFLELAGGLICFAFSSRRTTQNLKPQPVRQLLPQTEQPFDQWDEVEEVAPRKPGLLDRFLNRYRKTPKA
jgi:hypothetical protein